MRCKVCGKKLKVTKDRRYEVERKPAGLRCLVENSVIFEAFDCAYCGCQNVVGVREARLNAINEIDVENNEIKTENDEMKAEND